MPITDVDTTLPVPPGSWQMLPNTGAHVFGDDEIGEILEEHGFARVPTKDFSTIQWVRAERR